MLLRSKRYSYTHRQQLLSEGTNNPSTRFNPCHHYSLTRTKYSEKSGLMAGTLKCTLFAGISPAGNIDYPLKTYRPTHLQQTQTQRLGPQVSCVIKITEKSCYRFSYLVLKNEIISTQSRRITELFVWSQRSVYLKTDFQNIFGYFKQWLPIRVMSLCGFVILGTFFER